MNSVRLNVLALTRFGPAGASSRVRMYQFGRSLGDYGIRIEWCPLFDGPYLERLYSGRGRSVMSLIRSYSKRAIQLQRARQFDVMWIEKELWPYLPAIIDPGFLRRRVPYVVDYDDATFHTYDQHVSWVIRSLLCSKIDAVMRSARTVVVGNAYLADRAMHAGARCVRIVPSVVDIRAYVPRKHASCGGIKVGWIGSPGSQRLLEPLFPVLASCLHQDVDRFVTIGARYPAPRLANHEILPWCEQAEAEQLSRLDIGIMPVQEGPFERGKCGFKLIQYMAAGLPVIASPVGVNAELVVNGENGFLASSSDEWRAAVLRLRSDPELRETMGTIGRQRVARSLSVDVVTPQIAEILFQAAA